MREEWKEGKQGHLRVCWLQPGAQPYRYIDTGGLHSIGFEKSLFFSVHVCVSMLWLAFESSGCPTCTSKRKITTTNTSQPLWNSRGGFCLCMFTLLCGRRACVHLCIACCSLTAVHFCVILPQPTTHFLDIPTKLFLTSLESTSLSR